MPRPLQNRVLATGEIVAHPARGQFMGNRGVLHDNRKRLGRSRWKHKAWVTCRLKWKDWHRAVMSPGAYTELFFLDEAVALAAGHRPCGLCRNADYKAFRSAAGIDGPVADMDNRLHAERAVPRQFVQRRDQADAESLPDGTIIFDGVPKLLFDDAMLPVGAGGYGTAEPRAKGRVLVLTPALSRKALAAGYRPMLAL
ncbi:MAG: hypothetical protein AAF222_13195 [Pseudomonadota bacterium]